MNKLYPPISHPITYHFNVTKQHQLYVEECGNPAGVPVIFLHGGPGSGCQAYHRQFFNPEKYRIILFDQRGCGRSTPKGCLEENNSQSLLADMETIRQQLKIDQWLLFGGSWGATLALLYAQTFPEQVSGMILRGCFLATARDLEWFFGDGVARLFADEWQLFIADFNGEKYTSDQLIKLYDEQINSTNKDTRIKAAKAWSRWTGKIVTWTLEAKSDKENKLSEEALDQLIKEVQLEIHYAINDYFIEPNQLLNNCHKIQDIPTQIVHGRRDITCPMESSWRLKEAIPQAGLTLLPEAGHLANEPTMIDALISATDQMLKKI